MTKNRIDALRHASRKLVRELGILDLARSLAGPTPQDCHALIEIANEPGIAVSKLAELLVLSVSSASRLVNGLAENGFIEFRDSADKRQKSLFLTPVGHVELKKIDDFSNAKVQGALDILTDSEQEAIITALEKYGQALEKSRTLASQIKVLTLSTSRSLRRQIVAMVENIQKNEFHIPVSDDVNACVHRAEEEFYYNSSYNFWYAVDDEGAIIGCIGLKKIDSKNAELKKLFVAKQYRGKGVAQKLLEALLKAAGKHGFKKVWLGTVAKLASAQQFYNKCGFQRVAENELPKGFQKCHLDTLFFSAPVATLRVQR